MQIEAKRAVKLPDLKELEKIDGKIGILSTVQYSHLVEELLEKSDRFVSSKTLIHEGQILGCNVSSALKIKDKVDAFIFIGEGDFHPLKVALETKKPVYVLQMSGKIRKISDKDVENYERKRILRIEKAKSAKKFGIIVSVKPGQEKMNKAIEIQKKLKESYIFVCDNIPFNDLENFNDIDCWINTACPRIMDDADKFPSNIIDLEDVQWLTN